MPQSIQLSQSQKQSQVMAPQMRQGLAMLQMTALDLRAELQHQMEFNPLIESVTSPMEKVLSTELPEEHTSGAISERILDFKPDGEAAQQTLSANDADRDYFLQNMENFHANGENGAVDPDAQTKRQLFFDRQVKSETLHEHLYNQIAVSNIPEADWDLARILIEYIDDNGYFKGSIPDIMMVNNVREPRILATLKRISQLDPIGCGARDLRECLLFQMDKLDDSPWEDEVRRLIDRHLADIAAHRESQICSDLKIEPKDYSKVLAELRSLNPRPGYGFSTQEDASIYVRPEIFLRKDKLGKWIATVTDRDLPDIKISKKYLRMLQDPKCPAETKSYIRERLAAAETLIDLIEERQETIRKISQAIVDAQTAVFEQKSFTALKPLTQEQIAEKVGVHNGTVSRTVRNKYMSTPFGVFELRSFFVTGLSTENGDIVSNASVKDRIRQIIDDEDKSKPFSDEKISKMLKELGINCARRTVAKYREALGILGTADRKVK